MSVGIGREIIIILFFGKKEAAQFSFLGIQKWEPDIYIDSHQTFICSVLKPRVQFQVVRSTSAAVDYCTAQAYVVTGTALFFLPHGLMPTIESLFARSG